MPDHIDLSTITNPEYLHRMFSEGSFLQQCIEKDVKVVFGIAQISGLIDELFWSVRSLPGAHPLRKSVSTNKQIKLPTARKFSLFRNIHLFDDGMTVTHVSRISLY